MDLQFQPDCLEALALEAISCIVSNLGGKLLKWPSDRKLWKACESLGELLDESIPPIMANQVTSRLIRQIDELLTYRHKSNYAANLNSLLRAVTLPVTSALDLSHIMACFSLMCIRIRTLTSLHSLKLRRCIIPADRESIAMALHCLPCLEEFQCWYGCSDEIIMQIPKALRKLDVCWSRNVTDVSVAHIVIRGRNLEDIRISGTNISDEGLQDLLDKLRTVSGICNTTLKTFECNRVNGKHIGLLVKGFPCLQQIVLSVENDHCDISVLSSLEHLKVLRFSNGRISGIEQFLRQSGHRLKELELIGCHPDVIFKIGKYCKQLECLIFTSDSSEVSAIVEGDNSGFLSLQQVTLGLNKEELVEVLRHCVNLRILCLYRMDDGVIGNILANCKDSLQQVQELYCPGSLLSGNFADTVIEHCPNLKVLEGVDTGLELLKQRHPGLRIG